MQITRKNIDEIKRIQAELDVLLGEASEKVSLAKMNVKNKIKWTKNGQEIECEELNLWNETWELGDECDAYKALATKYPEAFEAVRKQNEKTRELEFYVNGSLGMSATRIKMTDIISIVEAVLDLKFSESEIIAKLAERVENLETKIVELEKAVATLMSK